MEDRPIKGNKDGKYNMNFIDWQNEYSNIYANYDENDPDADCPIPGMSMEVFQRLLAEQLEQAEYDEDSNFFEISESEKLPQDIVKNVKKMKIGKTQKQCTICFKEFQKGQIIRKLPCKHIFHDECILPWFEKKSNCPNCRFDIKEHFNNLDNQDNQEQQQQQQQ